MNYYADVILPLPIQGTFTYQLTIEQSKLLGVGFRVAVSFGKRKIYTGVIKQIHNQKPDFSKLKPIEFSYDKKALVTKLQIEFWSWISKYYFTPIGDVLKAAIPSTFLLESDTIIIKKEIDNEAIEKLTEEEFLIYEALDFKNLKIYLNNIDRNNKINLNVKIGVQHDTIQTSLASIIPEKLCFFDLFLDECNRKENISPKWINHNSAYPIISKLKTEELDFGIVGDYAISHLANQETNSAEDIVLVSFVSINPEGGGSNLILPRDSNVKSLDEFSKGSTIAVPFLSTAYGSLLYNLKSQNLRKEVTLKDYSINNINSIKETNVDAFAFFTPFDYLLESTKDFEILNESISAPISYYGVLVRKEFLQKNEDVVKAFIKSLISAKYWFYSASSTIQKISKWTGVSEKIVNSILGNRVGKDCHYIPDMKIRKDWIDTYTNEIYSEPGTVEFNQTIKKNPIIFEDLLNDAYKELNLK